jgi:hypothetical protein
MLTYFEIQMVQWHQFRIPSIFFRLSTNCLPIFPEHILMCDVVEMTLFIGRWEWS